MSLDLGSYLLGKSKGGGGETPVLIQKNITENGTYNASSDSADGYSKVNVNVPAPPPNLQDKEVTITSNTTTTISADTGYDGLGEVEVTTNVPNPSTGTITITQNGVVDVTNYASADVNVSGGADLSDYFENEIGSNSTTTSSNVRALSLIKKLPSLTNIGNKLDFAFYRCTNLEELPMLDTSDVTTFREFADGCSKITFIPNYDTRNVTNFSAAFAGCTNLRDVPVLSFASLANPNSMFSNCQNLTDTSLDNILQSCITAPASYDSYKTLTYLSIDLNYYSTSRIQALPHYQDFINAGWTIS